MESILAPGWNLEEMSIIVEEHSDMFKEDEIIFDCSSTVGLKWLLDGKLYGEYVRIMKPTLTVDEVVKTTNLLLQKFVCMNETKTQEEGERKNV